MIEDEEGGDDSAPDKKPAMPGEEKKKKEAGAGGSKVTNGIGIFSAMLGNNPQMGGGGMQRKPAEPVEKEPKVDPAVEAAKTRIAQRMARASQQKEATSEPEQEKYGPGF